MASKKLSRKIVRSLCGEVHPDDDADPRERARTYGHGRRPPDRKARQLCSQVARTLDDVCAGESGDDVLRGLHVASVVPAPDVARLLVTVEPLPGVDDGPDPVAVIEHLGRASARLRAAVAAAITRKRAPVLTFRYAVPGARATPKE
jgi:ribosome-binding factor A